MTDEFPELLDLLTNKKITVTCPTLFEFVQELFTTVEFNVNGAHYRFHKGDAIMAGLSLVKAITVELPKNQECSGE